MSYQTSIYNPCTQSVVDMGQNTWTLFRENYFWLIWLVRRSCKHFSNANPKRIHVYSAIKEDQNAGYSGYWKHLWKVSVNLCVLQCSFGLLHEADRLRMDCPSCGKSTCSRCKTAVRWITCIHLTSRKKPSAIDLTMWFVFYFSLVPCVFTSGLPSMRGSHVRSSKSGNSTMTHSTRLHD